MPPLESAKAVVHLEGAGKRYGESWALREVNLTLREGEIVGFIGPNGAGKTTLLRLMAGLTRASEGQVTVLGQNLTQGPLRTPEGLGLVLEDMGFVPYLSGRRNLELLARLRGVATREAIHEVLAQVGLDPRDKRAIRTYSLGMRQRLLLAQALMERPRLLLLDEPTNGLDPSGIVELRVLLKRLTQSGTTVFLASHLLAEVEQSCDRVLLVRQGRVLRELAPMGGSAAGTRLVVSSPQDMETVLAWARDVGLEATPLAEDRGRPALRLAGQQPVPTVVRELAARGVGIEEVGPLRQSLEEVFLALAAP